MSDRLLNLKEAKRKDKGYYIDFVENVGNPKFTNEYVPSSDYPDAGYRLLALYRYWNMVQYFYPNRHLIGQDWKNILLKNITPIINAKNEAEYVFTILQIINELHDTHANIWSIHRSLEIKKGEFIAPSRVVFIDNQAVIDNPDKDSASRYTPLRNGDIIVSVNDRKIEDIIGEKLSWYPASNHATKLRDIATDILRGNSNNLEVSYLRNGAKFTQKIKAYSKGRASSFMPTSSVYYKMLTDKIVYVNLGLLTSGDLQIF